MSGKDTMITRLYLLLLLIFTFAAVTGNVAAQSVNAEVVAGELEGAARVNGLAEASHMISDRFGESNLVGFQPYFGPGGEQSGISFEFFAQVLNKPVSVIYDISFDSPCVAAIWEGLPMHSDPERLSRASEGVMNKFGLEVGKPERICWFGGLNVWAVYSEVDIQSKDRIVCNLFDFRCATYSEIDPQGAASKPAKRAHRRREGALASVTTLQIMSLS